MKSLVCLMLLALPPLNAQQNSERAVGSGVNFYSVEKEAALGAQQAAEFERQAQLLNDAQVNAYVRSVGDRLLKQIPETGFTFHFAVFVDSENSGLHEPLVLPGAYIYVPESLILAARDEAEFTGILAHAIAHAANRDATRQASRANLANIATIPMMVTGGWSGYSARQGAEVAMPMAFLQFRRGLELQADYRAVPMMAGAGWDPEGLARFIEREQAPDPRKPGSDSRVFSPLPPLDERVAAIRKAIASLPPRAYSPAPEFAAIQAELRRIDAVRPPKAAPPAVTPPQK